MKKLCLRICHVFCYVPNCGGFTLKSGYNALATFYCFLISCEVEAFWFKQLFTLRSSRGWGHENSWRCLRQFYLFSIFLNWISSTSRIVKSCKKNVQLHQHLQNSFCRNCSVTNSTFLRGQSWLVQRSVHVDNSPISFIVL